MNEPLSMGRSHSASVDPSPRLSDDLTCLIIGHFLRQMVKFIQWLPLCDERIDTLQETPSIGDVIGGVGGFGLVMWVGTPPDPNPANRKRAFTPRLAMCPPQLAYLPASHVLASFF